MSDIEDRVIATIVAVFDNKGAIAPAISGLTALDASLGLKSLDYAELVARLEEEFGHDPFAEGAIPSIKTVIDLAALYADTSLGAERC